MNRSILVVDDDKKIVDLVALYLKRDGYSVVPAYDGQEALDMARRRRPDLVVLDLMLPELSGLDVCKLLRAESRVPIVMLTARAADEDKLRGLDLGADDYVTKPFNPRELVARVRAVLRRAYPDETPGDDLRYGDLVISFMRHEVTLGGKPANLTPTEFRLLEALVREPGRAFSRSELLDRAFGYDYDGVERTVDVHIMNLRRKVESGSGSWRYIATVPGLGYRFETPRAEDAQAEDRQPGNRISGDRLSGDGLSGDGLSGDRLSGDGLSGDRLSGDGLSGDRYVA